MEHKMCNLFRIAREIETQTALMSLTIEGTKIDDFARNVLSSSLDAIGEQKDKLYATIKQISLSRYKDTKQKIIH